MVSIHPFIRKNHLLLLLVTLSLSSSLPHHHHHTIRSKYPPHSSSEDENSPSEEDYENPYQIFSDDPSEYYSLGETVSDPPPPVYGAEETPEDYAESLGTITTTEGFDDDMKDDEFDHEEDEDEMENRDRRDLLRYLPYRYKQVSVYFLMPSRGQRQARTSKNTRCSRMNGQIKCSKRHQSLGPSSKQVLRTSRSFAYPLQHKREVKPKSAAENKEWKSFRNKEELFNYIEDIVLKPNLPPDESANKQGKKNKKVKSTINPTITSPTVKVGHTDPQDFQNSWVNFQKWMRNQLDQPGRRLEFESEFSKNQNRRDSIPNLGELSNKDKGKNFAVINVTTQVPIVETPFIFLDNPPQKVERYEFGPFKGTKYTEKTKDSSQMVIDKTIEEPAKTYVFPDVVKSPVPAKGVPEDVKQIQETYSMSDNITVGGNTNKEVKTVKTTPDVKAESPIPDRGKYLLPNNQPEKKVTQSVLNKNGFLFSDIGGNRSENSQVTKDKVFEYKFKVSSIEDKLIIPDPSKYETLFFNSTFNLQNSTKYPYNDPHIYNATPAMDDAFTAVFANTEPAEFLRRAVSYSSTMLPYTNKSESSNQLDMVIKLPENAFREMEESMRKRNKVVMKLDFERPRQLGNEYNAGTEDESTTKPAQTTIVVPKTSTDLYQDETTKAFSGQEGINMLKFAVKLTENMQESVNQRKDLTEAEKVLLYNIILQKFMKLLSIDIDLMSKNE